MQIRDIRKRAKELGIDPGMLSKVDLVHAIQQHEGFTTCFGQGVEDCPHVDCCFRRDCAKVSRKQQACQV